MITFELTDEQVKNFEKWKNEMKAKNSFIPTAGERWTFCFTPTGLGTIVHAIDEATHEEIDLTEWQYF